MTISYLDSRALCQQLQVVLDTKQQVFCAKKANAMNCGKPNHYLTVDGYMPFYKGK